MEKTELFNSLRVLMLEYIVAKFVNDNFTPETYFHKAADYILENKRRNLRDEFVDHLNFVEQRKFSEFIHDFFVYHNNEVIRLISAANETSNQENIEKATARAANEISNQQNIGTETIDFQNDPSSIVIAIDDRENIRGSSSKESVIETNMDINLPEVTAQTPLQLQNIADNATVERYSMLLHNEDPNLGDINDNPLPNDLNLPTPELQDNGLIDELQFDDNGNNVNKIRELLNRINLNNPNADISNNGSNTLIRRRKTNSPRISSVQRGQVPQRRTIITPKRRNCFTIRQHRDNNNNNTDSIDEYNERYIAQLNKEYLKIFDCETMKNSTIVDDSKLIPQIPDDDINIENFEPEPEIDPFQPFSINDLLQNYYPNDCFSKVLRNSNINSNIVTTYNNENIAENMTESIQQENIRAVAQIQQINDDIEPVRQIQQENDDTGAAGPISPRAFYGPQLSASRQLYERPQKNSLVVSVVDLPPIALDTLYGSYNPPINRTLSPVGHRNFIDILRPRDPNINFYVGGTIATRKKRKRRVNIRNQPQAEPNPVNNDFDIDMVNVDSDRDSDDDRSHIEEFKMLQEKFIKYHGYKYQNRPKFDFDCYTELYDREEIISSLDVFKLLITSHGQPIPRSDIFPPQISEREISYRRSAVESLTELQIAELLNHFDSEEDADNQDLDFVAIQLKKPKV